MKVRSAQGKLLAEAECGSREYRFTAQSQPRQLRTSTAIIGAVNMMCSLFMETNLLKLSWVI